MALKRYFFAYEMDGSLTKQGAYRTTFIADNKDTLLVCLGKYKNGYLYDTCKWYSLTTKTLYLNVVFKDEPSHATLFNVFYSGQAICEKGCRTGNFLLYYDEKYSTKLHERAEFVDGKLTGVHELYDQSGTLRRKNEYVDNCQNGPFVLYSYAGNIEQKGYINAEKCEEYTEHYVDYGRRKASVVKSKNGSIVYDSSFYEDGSIYYRKYYTGEQIDSAFIFYASGKLKSKEMYDKDGNGFLKEYYADGKPSKSENYVQRKLDGHYIVYYENGKKQLDYQYTNGKVNGSYYEWDEKGFKTLESHYSNDLRNGVEKRFQNGKLIEVSNYENGVLKGSTQRFDANGKAIRGQQHYSEPTNADVRIEEGLLETTMDYSSTNKLSKDISENQETYIAPVNQQILYTDQKKADCSAFPDLKPMFNKDTFLTHLKAYAATRDGKYLKKISTPIEFYITTSENTTVSSNICSRTINDVTYSTVLKKEQQQSFTQFLLHEKLIYSDPRIADCIYKLSYELLLHPEFFGTAKAKETNR